MSQEYEYVLHTYMVAFALINTKVQRKIARANITRAMAKWKK